MEVTYESLRDDIRDIREALGEYAKAARAGRWNDASDIGARIVRAAETLLAEANYALDEIALAEMA